MRSAADMHVHVFFTGSVDVAHHARQRFEIFALFCFSSFVRRLLFFPTEPTLLFCEPLAQLDIYAIPFISLFIGLSTKSLRVSDVELFQLAFR